MPGQQLGSLVGAAFGLVYVVVNAGPLPDEVALPIRALGVVAFLAVLAALTRRRTAPVSAAPAGGRPTGSHPVGAYWAVVGAEAVCLFGGLAVLNGVFDRPEAGVAWVSAVVGLHFFALAWVFRLPFFHLLGGVITACGVVGMGLVVAAAGPAPIAVVSGLVPGAVLLAAGWWGASRVRIPQPVGS